MPSSQAGHNGRHAKQDKTMHFTGGEILDRCDNDPSAGSPTETLLRLHLPLSDKV
jgi:hypothetical protein